MLGMGLPRCERNDEEAVCMVCCSGIRVLALNSWMVLLFHTPYTLGLNSRV
jgi:hypothetical protein